MDNKSPEFSLGRRNFLKFSSQAIISALIPSLSNSQRKNSEAVNLKTERIEGSLLENNEAIDKKSIILNPEDFGDYAYFGGDGIIDYLSESYQDNLENKRGLLGLWNRSVSESHESDDDEFQVTANNKEFIFKKITLEEGEEIRDIQSVVLSKAIEDTQAIVLGRLNKNDVAILYQDPIDGKYYYGAIKDKESQSNYNTENIFSEEFTEEFDQLGEETLQPRYYQVQEGNNLSSLAVKFKLKNWQGVYAWNLVNTGKNTLSLSIGEKIAIPDAYRNIDFLSMFDNDMSELSLDSSILSDHDVKEYIEETGHYVGEPFLSFYNKHRHLLGFPISEPTPGNSRQYFRNFIIEYGSKDDYGYYEGRPSSGNSIEQHYIYPAGWVLYYRQVLHPEKNTIEEFPKKGEHEIGEMFSGFFNDNGGEEIFGFPVSEVIDEDGIQVQWTVNSRLEFANGQVSIFPIGEMVRDLYGPAGKPWFTRREHIADILEAIKLVDSINEDEKNDVDRRTIGVLAFLRDKVINFEGYELSQRESLLANPGVEPLTDCQEEKRNFMITQYLAPGEKLNYANVKGLISLHKVRFEDNPALITAFEELKPGALLINQIIGELVPKEYFKGDYPEIDFDINNIVFAGGDNGLGGGLGYPHFPVLFGKYDHIRDPNSSEYPLLKEGLIRNAFHEYIHSHIQINSSIEQSNWWEQDEESRSDPNHVARGARRGLLAHMSMCAITSAIEDHFGLKPNIDSRVNYIYKILIDNGVKNALRELAIAASTLNSDRLWDLYESCRKMDDIPMDELMSTFSEPGLSEDDDGDFIFKKELENFDFQPDA